MNLFLFSLTCLLVYKTNNETGILYRKKTPQRTWYIISWLSLHQINTNKIIRQNGMQKRDEFQTKCLYETGKVESENDHVYI